MTTYTSSNIAPDIFTLPFGPYFLILAACLMLGYKRAIDLNYKIITGLILGIIIYFGFSFNFANSMQLINVYTSQHIDIVKKASNYMILYNTISAIITLLTIGLVIYFAIQKGEKDSSINRNTTAKYILNLGIEALLFIVLMFVIVVPFFLIKFDDTLFLVLVGIVVLTALIYYLYLTYKQSKGFRFLFYINLLILIIYSTLPIGLVIIAKFFYNVIMLKFYLSILTGINMLFIVSNISFISIKTSEQE